ncbi:MAG: ABC transporter ATP-binding protein [Calditrichaeota bacterium]|nr:ABC transporter ATP-binding protein [Calditrichota bacterium]
MLRFVNVSKSYGTTRAVDNLSFSISAGEVFGLLGPNGAGKTTTVSLAVGLLKPDSGQVLLEGNSGPDDASNRAHIGIAPQALALYEGLTGEENVTFFGKLAGLQGKELRKQVAWALDFVGLTARGRDRVRTYSGGMKRRLNLAIAVVHRPPLLLLDEPTVGVDPQSRNAIFENIETLASEGHAILYTTHYMEEAERLCNRVGILDHGRLLALDTVPNLIRTYGEKPVLIAEDLDGEKRIACDDPVAELVKLQKTGRYRRFRIEQPTLESVFLNLTGRQLRD